MLPWHGMALYEAENIEAIFQHLLWVLFESPVYMFLTHFDKIDLE